MSTVRTFGNCSSRFLCLRITFNSRSCSAFVICSICSSLLIALKATIVEHGGEEVNTSRRAPLSGQTRRTRRCARALRREPTSPEDDDLVSPKTRMVEPVDSADGRLAQLGERLPYKQEVAGSSPAPPMLCPSGFAPPLAPRSSGAVARYWPE